MTLHEAQSVDVKDERAAGDFGAVGVGEEGVEGGVESLAGGRLQNNVETVDALDAGDGGGAGAENSDTLCDTALPARSLSGTAGLEFDEELAEGGGPGGGLFEFF